MNEMNFAPENNARISASPQFATPKLAQRSSEMNAVNFAPQQASANFGLASIRYSKTRATE
jgi:hypothetical protein